MNAVANNSLESLVARDLMTANPVSIREDATIADAIRFLTEKGITGAVVIGGSGRPVGVVSDTDVLIHERERLETVHRPDMGFVRDVMTPAVFTVRPGTSVRQIAQQMAALNVHRLFVVDDDDVVVGVVTALDIVRRIS